MIAWTIEAAIGSELSGWVYVCTEDEEIASLAREYGAEEDLEVFTRIFEALYQPGKVFGLAEVVKYLRDHPEVMKLNSSLDEEYWRRTREKAQLFHSDARGEFQKI